MTRYALLRDTIAYFAAPAEVQLTHDLGADDAVNDMETFFGAHKDMIAYDEITLAEVDAIRPLDDLITRFCASDSVKPWEDEDEAPLFSDPLWAEIRCLAMEVIAQLPDEKRESDYTRSL